MYVVRRMAVPLGNPDAGQTEPGCNHAGAVLLRRRDLLDRRGQWAPEWKLTSRSTLVSELERADVDRGPPRPRFAGQVGGQAIGIALIDRRAA